MPNKLSDTPKPERQQKLYRQLRLLTPESAQSASELHAALEASGVKASRKTITRDLLEIAGVVATGSTPERYYLSPDYRSDHHVQLNEDELQIILIALAQLKQSGPRYFRELSKQAEASLKEKLPKSLAKEFSKLQGLAVANPSLTGRDRSEDQRALELVLSALRSERMIECENHSPYSPEKNTTRRTFGPLVLNMVGGIPYVLMHDPLDETHPVKNLRLSRLHEVRLLDKKVQRSMLKHAKTMELSFSGFGGTTEDIVDFEIQCRKSMGVYFMEREINHTQVITPEGEGYRIRFRSHASLDLIRLLAGFGDEIKTLRPLAQFRRLQAIWQKAPGGL